MKGLMNNSDFYSTNSENDRINKMFSNSKPDSESDLN